MKKITGILMAALLSFMAVSCSDLNKLEDDFSSLENRVDMLEKVLPGLNNNIEALQGLVSATTINAVELKDGVYTITLSNGEKLTLTQGSIGVGKTPVMSVDKDGFWMVDYQDGKGAAPILSDGQKVRATGLDGVTPRFGVDKDGFWTVSYNGGQSFEQVKDPEGKPVQALPEGTGADPFFRDVKYEGEVFTVVLNNGESLVLPVVSSFLCAIQDAAGIQNFNLGETRVYNVEMKGVVSTVVTAPEGWTAVLSEKTLTVTAPAPAQSLTATKALAADTRTDVSILAISAQGLSTIAKIRISSSDQPVAPSPVATVTAGEATDKTLTFNVAVVDVTAWKYIFQKSAEPAPDAEQLMASGIDGDKTALTFNTLDAKTSYTLYVLPVNGDIKGRIASANLSTLAPVVGNDLYQAYMDGLEIEIAGLKFSKAVNGEALLITAEKALTDIKPQIAAKTAVVFLDSPEGTSFTVSGNFMNLEGQVAVIGRYADKKAVFSPAAAIKLMKGRLVMKNLIVDQESSTQAYMMLNSKDTGGQFHVFEGIYLEDCDFVGMTKNLTYMSETNVPFSEIIVRNCVFEFSKAGTDSKVLLFNLREIKDLEKFSKIVFDNNLVYNSQGVSWLQVFSSNDGIKHDDTAAWNTDASICNNTFYNVPGGNGYFKFYQVRTLKMTGNIFYAEPDFIGCNSYNNILFSTNQTETGLELDGNIAYGLGESKNWLVSKYFKVHGPATNTIEKLAATPFQTADPANGKFIPKAEYAAYGVQTSK